MPPAVSLPGTLPAAPAAGENRPHPCSTRWTALAAKGATVMPAAHGQLFNSPCETPMTRSLP